MITKPKFDESVFVCPGAAIVGDVTLGKNVNVWYNAVLRGDDGAIKVGDNTNVQDCAVLHEETTVGSGCTIGHGAIVHGCTVGNNVLVGCGAKVLGPLTIADNCKIAAGAVVLTDIPENSTAVGIPARIVRRHGRKVDDLDQVHIPDPVAQELRKLRKEVNDLKKQVASLHSADSDDSGGRQAQE